MKYMERKLEASVLKIKILIQQSIPASKAAAEVIINSHKYAYKKDIITIRGNNVYGIRQFPEKLIPRCITSLIKNKKMPIHVMEET